MPSEFTAWFTKSNPVTIVFEAGGTSNYCKQKSFLFDMTPPYFSKISSRRKAESKKDKNNALAIFQATLLPDVVFISEKSIEQQRLHSIIRFRELSIEQKTATGNQLIAFFIGV